MSRDHEQRPETRVAWWRRLDLIGPDRRTFLRRRGIDLPRFGVYLHRIDAPDPGLDLHDHPWAFVSIILRGGYTEEWADVREAPALAAIAEEFPGGETPGVPRSWGAWTAHRMPLNVAHRITAAEPGTVSLVIRGRKVRRWGFYLPSGWVDWEAYDYDARRPLANLDAALAETSRAAVPTSGGAS